MRLKLLFLMMFAALLVVGCNKTVLNDETTPPPLQEKPDGDNPANVLFDDKFFTDVLDLNYPGLERVKEAFDKGEKHRAMSHLLEYYRLRSNVIHPDVKLVNVTTSNNDIDIANYAIEHKFVSVTTGSGNIYKDYYNPADTTINWALSDPSNEVMWQLHRHKWFVPLAKMYRSTGDEKWFTAWATQYLDWIKNNRPVNTNPNRGYSWRSLEVADRAKVQSEMIFYMINSPNYTPELLYAVLNELNLSADYVAANYSDDGNHRVIQSHGVLFAGAIFPELKNSTAWLNSGSSVMNEAVKLQVVEDGMHYELDYGYHIGTIADFFGGYNMVKANGKQSVFPSDYVDNLRGMMEVVKNITLPDFTIPQFNDTRRSSYEERVLTRNLRTYYGFFPDDAGFLWLGTSRREGKRPAHLNKYFKTSGYYVLRNGWEKNSTVMVHSNGPDGFTGGWHKHPDNGTFELYAGDKNFFPDSGVYQYEGAGDIQVQRNRFRQTRMHNTLTLDLANIASANMNGKCLLADTYGSTDIVVTQNESYPGFTHRRAIFFVEKRFFVIVDDASGSAAGVANLNYHLIEGDKVQLDLASHGAHTTYATGYNIFTRTFSPGVITTTKFEQGAVSYAINNKIDRGNSCYIVNQNKAANDVVRYITVIVPVNGDASTQVATASFDRAWSATSEAVTVTLNGTTHKLNYTIE